VDLGEGHWVWPEHFPGDPVFPGTLILEAAGQLVASWAWAGGARGRPRLVRISGNFQSPAGPGARSLLLKGEVERKRQIYFGKVQVCMRDIRLATVEVALVVLPPTG
jgi:3-hydroxymyristoyl/3-hydroxydecanoyl-(acyl carrier protein) dehydratase